jgi:ABC-type lipoprotein release transport system permease subunit
MTYRRILLSRWSRRDWLAVLVIAVAVAFLVGTVLVVTAAETQTTAIAGEYTTTATVTTHDSVAAAREAAGPNVTLISFSVVTGPTDQRRYVLGRPTDGSADSVLLNDATGVTVGTLDTSAQHQLRGPAGTVTASVSPRDTTDQLPRDWYLAPQETVADLGVSGVFAVQPTTADVPTRGVPLRTALAFFVFGSRELLGTLWAVAGGSAVLIAVVVYSVTRMTVRDRRDTIDVVRATGGTARTLLGTFGLRAALLSLVGAALGYAIGVIAVNAAVNLAVFLGLPTALHITVTPRIARLLAPLCGGVIVVGGASGVAAAWPAVRGPPLRAQDGGDGGHTAWVPAVVRPTILDWRALVPTAATLSTFVVFVVLVAAIAGVMGPLTAAGGATITEPNAPHPFASNVPAPYADALRAQGVNASAEILVLQTHDSQPYAARGVNYSAFTSVTNTTLVSGRPPRAPEEAVIGTDLATTLGLQPGDSLTLGGPVKPKLSRVTIVGTFRAPGPYDDQLLVSRATATHLAGKRPGMVQFIRAERLPDTGLADANAGVHVTDVAVPAQTLPNSSLEAQVTVHNVQESTVTRTVSVSMANETVTRTVRLAGGESTTLAVPISTAGPGTYTLTAGGVNRSVDVLSRDAIDLVGLPARAPPNASVQVRVRTPYGDPVANATVTVTTPEKTQNETVRTNSAGIARIEFNESGQHTVLARKDGQTAQATMTVHPEASRQLLTTIAIDPATPDPLTSPTARIELVNPWAEPVARAVALTGPGREVRQSVRLAPGATRTLTVSLPRRPPGSYEVAVTTNKSAETHTSYRVTGDERIAAAIASGGHTGTSGIGQAIETAFGNLQFVLAVVTGLAAAMTVGGTTATFAQAIQARRRTIGIYRATGAGPLRVARLVLADALRIGAVASVGGLGVGLVALRGLAAAGYLTVFGVRLSPTPSVALLGGIVAGALAITLLGAGLATLGLLVAAPATLLAQRGRHSRPSSVDEAP